MAGHHGLHREVNKRQLAWGDGRLSFALATRGDNCYFEQRAGHPFPTVCMFELRPYQQEAIAAVLEARNLGRRRLLVCLPTGAGKTVIFSNLIKILRRPALVLAHRSELIDQAVDKIQAVLGPGKAVHIEKAAQRAGDDADVVVASIRSLHTTRLDQVLQGRQLGLVIYDECHHAPAMDNMRVLRELGVFAPRWNGLLVGFTATTQRGDRAGLDGVFEDIVYQRTLPTMIREGYLVPLRGFRVTTQADLTALTSAGADFDVQELEEAIDIRGRNALVARAIQELARDRRTLAFCVTVKHARNLASALNDIGVSAAVIHGESPPDVRASLLRRFRSGELQALTNVGVLTEGFDDPGVSCVAMARPTRSEALYTQCVGRGTRLHPGKTDCLVLDFVDLSSLSLVSLPSLFGLPRQLDLDGDDVLEAEERLGVMFEQFPTFEIPPEDITLAEIKRRAEAFDPITLDIDADVKAISPNAWTSLGSAGIALFFLRRAGRLSEFLVLDSRRAGKERYVVYLDGEPVRAATFSTLAAAVEAVDYELQRFGDAAIDTASPDAAWRYDAPSDAQQAALAKLKPPRTAVNKDQAVHYLAYARYARKAPPRRMASEPR